MLHFSTENLLVNILDQLEKEVVAKQKFYDGMSDAWKQSNSGQSKLEEIGKFDSFRKDLYSHALRFDVDVKPLESDTDQDDLVHTNYVLSQVFKERLKQEQKWGQQNHPIIDPDLWDQNHRPGLMGVRYGILSEDESRRKLEQLLKLGKLSYFDILMEEICEASQSPKEGLREELVQIAAVTVAMIESLDRNGK